jgi:hypothetical protein
VLPAGLVRLPRGRGNACSTELATIPHAAGGPAKLPLPADAPNAISSTQRMTTASLRKQLLKPQGLWAQSRSRVSLPCSDRQGTFPCEPQGLQRPTPCMGPYGHVASPSIHSRCTAPHPIQWTGQWRWIQCSRVLLPPEPRLAQGPAPGRLPTPQ